MDVNGWMKQSAEIRVRATVVWWSGQKVIRTEIVSAVRTVRGANCSRKETLPHDTERKDEGERSGFYGALFRPRGEEGNYKLLDNVCIL